jgi:hypothetical protein
LYGLPPVDVPARSTSAAPAVGEAGLVTTKLTVHSEPLLSPPAAICIVSTPPAYAENVNEFEQLVESMPAVAAVSPASWT